MALRDDRDPVDREIIDIIPERYDSDPDSLYARKGAHTRLILTIALALLAVAALGVAARHIFFGEAPSGQQASVPVIHADDKPIKTKPDDRGGMEVPNQDKLVYQRMGSGANEPQTERLLPPPEQPQAPPAPQQRQPSIKPAFTQPVPAKPTAPEPPTPPAVPPPQVAVTTPPPPPTTPSALSPAKPTSPALPAVSVPKVAAPAAAPAPVTASPPAAAAKAASGGAWIVQLASLASEADAKATWTKVRAANRDLLGDLTDDIARADLGSKGVFWRLRVGPMDEAKARTLCSALEKRSERCFVAKK